MAFPFLSNGTFLRFPPKDSKMPLAIAGIAWDGCVTNRPGARFGPSGIRTASLQLCDGLHPLFESSPTCFTTDYGDLEIPNTSLENMRAALMPLLKPLIMSHDVAWLGGDHSVTLPILRGYAASDRFTPQKSGKAPFACIHFDAHCDTWVDHFGEPSGHGTWVFEAVEENLIIPECTFQFGIRSSGDKSAREFVTDKGGMIFTARCLRGLDGARLLPIIKSVVERLRDHGNPPVYMTFDIDCLDPAFAPGTGTPEPGGLASSQALTLVEGFCAELGPQLIGFDVVEVSPPYDHAELTTSAASTLIWTYLSAKALIIEKGHEHARELFRASFNLPH
mmetsp:Transcript_62366/g.72544  ORF Transcript_62366/g.72544 Transcript_62366/m.72544 type:complete len:335 (+) Transcript_62366:46-1050(+)